MTAIQPDATCDAVAIRLGPDQQFLRFDIDGSAPISKAIAPGAHVRARVVASAPKPFEMLRVSWLELKWEWPIPGSD